MSVPDSGQRVAASISPETTYYSGAKYIYKHILSECAVRRAPTMSHQFNTITYELLQKSDTCWLYLRPHGLVVALSKPSNTTLVWELFFNGYWPLSSNDGSFMIWLTYICGDYYLAVFPLHYKSTYWQPDAPSSLHDLLKEFIYWRNIILLEES